MKANFLSLFVRSCILLFAIGIPGPGRSQQIDWVSQLGSPGYDFGYAVTVDKKGNVFSAGDFSGDITFSNGLQVSSLGERDAYISMHDPDGVLQWVKTFGGTATTNATAVRAMNNGQIVVAGSYFSDTDFDPISESPLTPNRGGADVYVACMDFRGKVVWIKTFGGTGNDHAYSLAVDHENNVIIAGDFEDELDFDPGKPVNTLASAGDFDSFIVKLNADGEFLWVKTIGGMARDILTSVSVDGNGNIYGGGFFSGISDFDPSDGSYLLYSAGSFDGFLMKMDPVGNLNWARQFSGVSYEFINSVAVDKNGTAYATGCFTETTDFDPGPDSFLLESEGFMDVFTVCINTSGNLEWAKRTGSKYNDYGSAITTDGMSNVFITGFFTGEVDMDPGDLIQMQQSFELGADVFVISLDKNGNYRWADTFGSKDEDTGYGIAAGEEDEVYVTGVFQETIFFNDELKLNSMGSTDVFVAKFQSAGTSVKEETALNSGVKIFPNPAEEILFLEFENLQEKTQVLIMDMNGKMVEDLWINQSSTVKIDIHHLVSGTYFVNVISGENKFTTSFIKSKD